MDRHIGVAVAVMRVLHQYNVVRRAGPQVKALTLPVHVPTTDVTNTNGLNNLLQEKG